MGEAILAKAQVSVKDIEPSGINNCMIVENGYYTCTKSGNYKVVCIGGGAGGAANIHTNLSGWDTYHNWYSCDVYTIAAPGASGHYNSSTIHLNNGDNVYVTIGSGGIGASWSRVQGTFGGWNNTHTNATSGGITSFGSYVAANGGSPYINNMLTAGYNNGQAVLHVYDDDGYVDDYRYSNNGYFSYPNPATGGYLYFNGTFDVSNTSSGGLRLYYGEGGNSGTVTWNSNNYYWINSNGCNGNNGVVFISWAD